MTLYLSGPEDPRADGTPKSPPAAAYLQSYRINALRVTGGIAVLLMSITSPPPASPVVTVFLNFLGAIAIFVAIAGRAWCLFYIGGRKNTELVRHGPYSVSRNPLYFFSLVGIAGIGVISGSVLIAITLVVTTHSAFALAIRGEEKYLAGRYGVAFADYREIVPRLLPNPCLWHDRGDVLLRSRNALGSLRDGIVFLAGWFALELVEVAQEANVLPVLWTLPM